jgi:hypothetical protein
MTAYITNADFNIGTTTGWTIDTPLGGNCGIKDGVSMEYWAGNASDRSQASFNIYQEISNLPAGAYTVSADMYNSLNGEENAEFTPTCGLYGISNNEEVALVNEEGTIAAAITASTLNGESNPSDILTPVYFTADHPFVYVISNMKTGVVYFIGTYQG